MILVGQYDSPYVRRVAVSLRVLGFDYEHDTRSVFADFDAMRALNPLGRIPSLVLDDGEVLIDSAAILDFLDQTVGPDGRSSPDPASSAGGPSSGSRSPPARSTRSAPPPTSA
ncbi:MAG: glutathione S-transferase N-terminal domain-containing protein [Geminicoccaceae bacterium]